LTTKNKTKCFAVQTKKSTTIDTRFFLISLFFLVKKILKITPINQLVDSTLMKTQTTSAGAFLNDGILQFNDSTPNYGKSRSYIRKFGHLARNYVLITKRMQLAILTCLGLVISFSVRCNMGVVVVALTTEDVLEDTAGKRTIVVSIFTQALYKLVPTYIYTFKK